MRLIIISWLLINACFGQNQKELLLKTAPLGILDFYNGPQLNLSLETSVFSRCGLNSELGFHFPFLDFIYNWNDVKGFVWKEEFRVYFPEEKMNGTFWSLETGLGFQTYGRTDMIDYYPLVPDSVLTYTSTRKFAGLTANLGQQLSFDNKLIVEFYFGAGFRMNQIETSLSADDNERRYFGDWTVPHNWIQRDGLHVIPKFNFGFRIGLCVND